MDSEKRVSASVAADQKTSTVDEAGAKPMESKPTQSARAAVLVMAHANDGVAASCPIGGRREFLPEGAARKERTAEQIAAAAPALDYPVAQVGTVGNMTLYYDPALGAQGLSLARQFLNVRRPPLPRHANVLRS
jgi:hypothetical protein